MSNKYLIIDFNSIGYAAQDGAKLHHNGKEVQAIYNFIRTLKKLAVQFPGYRMIAVDDGYAQWRYDLYPPYKANRRIVEVDEAEYEEWAAGQTSAKLTADEKRFVEKQAYRSQKPAICRAIGLLGVEYLMQEDAEADDLATHVARKLTEKSLENYVTLVTSDKDWIQLVSPQITWHDPKFGRSCHVENFKEFTGYDSPIKFLQSKALIGDNSDYIYGVSGIGDVAAREMLEQYQSVENFVEQAKAGKIEKLTKAQERLVFNLKPDKMATKRGDPMPQLDVYNRNMELMNLLVTKVEPAKETLVWRKAEFDRKGFMDFCESYYFKSIINQFAEFTAPFTRENHG